MKLKTSIMETEMHLSWGQVMSDTFTMRFKIVSIINNIVP